MVKWEMGGTKMSEWLESDIFLKLIIAFIFGTILGLERSLKRKNASLKTGIVLTIASCMVTIVSIESAALYSSPYDMPMDPLRLAAQLISGISFIGAGIILTKNNDAVSGLTTAAIMWASVGFGISIGAGFYLEATVSLILIMFGVEVLPILVQRVGPRRLNEQQIKVRLKVDDQKELSGILKEMKKEKIVIHKVKIKDMEENPRMDCMITVHHKRYITDIYRTLKSIDGILHVEVESI
jgi:putative Mg2+ transporter-C (MgtC) family protein